MALTPWATHVIQWPVQRAAKPRGGANRIKTGPSSDWRLQLASMKSDLLVTVGQHTTVNTFPVLVQNKCAWQRTRLVGENPTFVAEDRAYPVRDSLKGPKCER